MKQYHFLGSTISRRVIVCTLMCLCTLFFLSCSDDYNDSELRDNIENLTDRVAALEAWQKSVNTDIQSLQNLVAALENKNFITNVTLLTEGGVEVGYTITFQNGDSITIRHGKNGTNGTNGQTPIIGVAEDTDGVYYWTVRLGEGQAEFLTDGSGNKIPVTGPKGDTGDNGNTGNDGQTPHIGENGNWWIGTQDTGVKAQGNAGNDGQTPHIGGNGNWWIGTTDTGVKAQGDKGTDAIAPQVRIDADSNEWEISTDGGATWTSTGVKATGDKGDKGDAVFAENGIDYTSDPDNVTFTLADGTTLILPRTRALTVGFDSYETFMLTPTTNVIDIILPTTLKEEDYTALVAEIKNEAGTGMDIATRVASSPWQVTLTKPTFVNGEYQNDAKATVTATSASNGDRAVLKITLIGSKGQEISASRVLEYFNGVIVNVSQAGGLNAALDGTAPSDITALRVWGTMSEDDFTYIRENLTALKTLDLSGTDLTVFPDRALAFYDNANTTLKEVILPEGLTTIEDEAFVNSTALEKLNVPSTVTTLGRWILKNTKVSSFTIPDGVTEIPANCFRASAITAVEIPSSVQTIGNCAFLDTKLSKVVIPSSVTSIGTWAFGIEKGTETLQSVTIEANTDEIPECCFYLQRNLTSLSLSDGIVSIGADAFNQCKIASLVLPPSLEEIGARAFSNNGITKLTIPDKVTTIANAAFASNNIAVIDLPASITSIHATAFNWKLATTVVCRATTVPETPQTAEFNNSWPPFNEVDKEKCVLKVPAESLSEYRTAWGSYFNHIEAIN